MLASSRSPIQKPIVSLCYFINSPTSLENVVKTWVPETRHYCPDAPFVLVGTKTDLRNDTCALEKDESEGR